MIAKNDNVKPITRADQVDWFEAPHLTAETDPNGKDAHETGSKLDSGKIRMGLVFDGFHNSLAAVAAVGTFGAEKYTDHGFLSVPNGVQRYTDAMLRHLMKEYSGSLNDSDSGLMHAAHLAWNALTRLELQLRERQNGTD